MSPIVSPNVLGSSAIDLRAVGISRSAIVGDLVVGDRADRAQLLRDDQVGLELAQRALVELVDRLAALGALAHRGVDLAPSCSPAGSTSRVTCGSVAAPRRVIALVRDADDVVAEPEREQQLGRVGHEADDPHRGS